MESAHGNSSVQSDDERSELLPQKGTTSEGELESRQPNPFGAGEALTRRQLFISLGLSLLVLAFSHSVWSWLGASLPEIPLFYWLEPVFATLLFVYAGSIFLRSSLGELRRGKPGMMTLVLLAVCLTYAFNVFLLFTPDQPTYFWELAILIDLLLLFYRVGSNTERTIEEDIPLENAGLLHRIVMQIMSDEDHEAHVALLDQLVTLDEQRNGMGRKAESTGSLGDETQPPEAESAAGEVLSGAEPAGPDVPERVLEQAIAEEDESEDPFSSRSQEVRERRERLKLEQAKLYDDTTQDDDQEEMTRQILHEVVEKLKEPPKIEPPKRGVRRDIE
jgi:hypothetical protein